MNILEKLLKMQNGDIQYLNWFEEGGGEVIKSDSGWTLYEVPHYGGIPRLYDIFTEDKLSEMIAVAYSWT